MERILRLEAKSNKYKISWNGFTPTARLGTYKYSVRTGIEYIPPTMEVETFHVQFRNKSNKLPNLRSKKDYERVYRVWKLENKISQMEERFETSGG